MPSLTSVPFLFRLRRCAENEIERWIDYSFSIRSIRELEAKKPLILK